MSCYQCIDFDVTATLKGDSTSILNEVDYGKSAEP